MNLQHERIDGLCSQLKLDRIASDWGALAQHAATTDASLADFLEQLLQAELGAREERKRQTLTKLASLPGIKTLEQYDFGFASGAPRAQIVVGVRRYDGGLRALSSPIEVRVGRNLRAELRGVRGRCQLLAARGLLRFPGSSDLHGSRT
ncbi:hypothetical protein RALBFv3_21360 (plasmid) [Ralstonia solanacearum]|nr:hypothetical protein RALBFv3_21360 [Ralstonia solanacearum]